ASALTTPKSSEVDQSQMVRLAESAPKDDTLINGAGSLRIRESLDIPLFSAVIALSTRLVGTFNVSSWRRREAIEKFTILAPQTLELGIITRTPSTVVICMFTMVSSSTTP